jgi:phasin family protein
MITLEQISAANKSNVETLLGLANKAFEGLERIVELNMQAIKATVHENIDHTKKSLSTKDAQEFLSVQANLLQPIAEKALAYGRQYYEILAHTQAQFTQATEAQMAENSQKIQAFADGVVKSAPAGSESATAMLKAAIHASNIAYETVYKAAKQAAEMTESNIQAATQVANKAVDQSYTQRNKKTHTA